MAVQRQRSKTTRKKRKATGWSPLRDAAYRCGLRGAQQWKLLHHFEHLGYRYRRSVWKGRRRMAKELGGVDPRNTRRRIARFEQLGLVRVVRGGGRMRGSRKDKGKGLIGLANRHYPGPKLLPEAITDRWIADDDARELERTERRSVQFSRTEVEPSAGGENHNPQAVVASRAP